MTSNAQAQSPQSAPSTGADSAARAGRMLQDHPLAVLSGVLVILVLITAAIEPSYLSWSGLRSTALYAAPLGILAASQTVLMLTAGIDLSVAMVATGAAYIAGNKSPEGAAIAIALGLLVGLIAGSANGIGVGVFQVNPLIMTLAMSAILLGLFTRWAQTWLSGGTLPADLIRELGGGSVWEGGLPWAVVIWAIVAVVIIGMLRFTGFGRMLYAIGDNPVATRLAGVRSWQVLLVAYALSGVLAAVAGILLAGRVGAVDLQLAANFLLPSVAAAVIGGTSIFGGMGKYSGTILGALILGVLNSMLIFMNAGQAVQQILYGSIVLGLAWLYSSLTAQ